MNYDLRHHEETHREVEVGWDGRKDKSVSTQLTLFSFNHDFPTFLKKVTHVSNETQKDIHAKVIQQLKNKVKCNAHLLLKVFPTSLVFFSHLVSFFPFHALFIPLSVTYFLQCNLSLTFLFSDFNSYIQHFLLNFSPNSIF